VLITGETGTGKELVARTIHSQSPRAARPFLAVNCGALRADLALSQLFGHRKGAFTGAHAEGVGLVEAAHGGTLFLDEIGELPLELQPKLLRAIQEQEFERLGSSQPTRVDVRILAATNQDLDQMLAERTFRPDLYYRLNVFPITVPPLRERTGDISVLINHFLCEFARRQGRSVPHVPDHVMEAFEAYDWPGNVRELQNILERSMILSTGSKLRAPIDELTSGRVPIPGSRTLAEADRAHIVSALRETNWVIGGPNGAAARLGLNRTTLIAKMRKLGISRGAAFAGLA